MKKTITLLLTTLIIFTGCVNDNNDKYIELFAYRPILVDGIENWEEHTNSEYLYSFKYPPDARVVESAAYGIKMDTVFVDHQSIINIIVKDPEQFEDNNTEIAELYKENLETFIEKTCKGEKGFKYHFRSEDAYTFQSSTCDNNIENIGEMRENDLFFTEYNGLIYEINYDQSPLTNDILSTFNFISENERPEPLDKSSYEYCLKKFKNQSNKEECLQFYIEEGACKEFIENKTYQAKCYWNLALQKKDKSICENLPEETIKNVNDKDSVNNILDYNVVNCKNSISYTADGVEWEIAAGSPYEEMIIYKGNTILEGWIVYKTYYSTENVAFFHVADMTKLPPNIRFSDYFLNISDDYTSDTKDTNNELLEKLKGYDKNNMAKLLVDKLMIGYESTNLYVVEILN